MSDKGKAAWDKAAACEAHARATSDGKLQAMFRKLRDSGFASETMRNFPRTSLPTLSGWKRTGRPETSHVQLFAVAQQTGLFSQQSVCEALEITNGMESV